MKKRKFRIFAFIWDFLWAFFWHVVAYAAATVEDIMAWVVEFSCRRLRISRWELFTTWEE